MPADEELAEHSSDYKPQLHKNIQDRDYYSKLSNHVELTE